MVFAFEKCLQIRLYKIESLKLGGPKLHWLLLSHFTQYAHRFLYVLFVFISMPTAWFLHCLQGNSTSAIWSARTGKCTRSTDPLSNWMVWNQTGTSFLFSTPRTLRPCSGTTARRQTGLPWNRLTIIENIRERIFSKELEAF